MTGAEIWRITRWGSRSSWDPICLDEQSRALIAKIEQQMASITVTGEDNYRTIWLWDDRGSAEAFREIYEDESEKELSNEELEKEFEEEFPDERMWFSFTTRDYNGHKTYVLGKRFMIYTSPDADTWEYDYSEILDWISRRLKAAVQLLREGSYNSFVSENIPKKYRTGTIKRSDLWSIMPEYREWEMETLSDEDIDRFCRNTPDLFDPEITGERIHGMCLDTYREYCAMCYKANRYEHWDEWTAEELFKKYSDDRNGGLTKLEPKSAEAFDEWYDIRDKWSIENPSHLWEARMGSSRTNIHLYVCKDEEGYYLSLCGCVPCMADELAMWYLGLTENGIGVNFSEYEAVKNYLLGADLVGIVGDEDETMAYAHGGFPASGTGSYISYPEEGNTDKLNELTEWLEIPKVVLATE